MLAGGTHVRECVRAADQQAAAGRSKHKLANRQSRPLTHTVKFLIRTF